MRAGQIKEIDIRSRRPPDRILITHVQVVEPAAAQEPKIAEKLAVGKGKVIQGTSDRNGSREEGRDDSGASRLRDSDLRACDGHDGGARRSGVWADREVQCAGPGSVGGS